MKYLYIFTNNSFLNKKTSIISTKKRGKKIKEIIQDGKMLSGYYQLPVKEKGTNRFIVFKWNFKGGSVTLIYIERELAPDDLITLLFMKKDL